MLWSCFSWSPYLSSLWNIFSQTKDGAEKIVLESPSPKLPALKYWEGLDGQGVRTVNELFDCGTLKRSIWLNFFQFVMKRGDRKWVLLFTLASVQISALELGASKPMPVRVWGLSYWPIWQTQGIQLIWLCCIVSDLKVGTENEMGKSNPYELIFVNYKPRFLSMMGSWVLRVIVAKDILTRTYWKGLQDPILNFIYMFQLVVKYDKNSTKSVAP